MIKINVNVQAHNLILMDNIALIVMEENIMNNRPIVVFINDY